MPGVSELQQFVLRSQVISLYRQFVRAVRGLPAGPRGEVLQQVRSEFERYKQAPDLYAVKYHLSDGRERLKQLTDMIGLSR